MEFVESEFDKNALKILRSNVNHVIGLAKFYEDREFKVVLDIAPQDHNDDSRKFYQAQLLTLDIDPNSNADYICDLCNKSDSSPEDEKFDAIICTEVLEHTLNPFKAVDELYRMLKPGGYVYVTTPFNFRIHGPSPDAWRFTRAGLVELFKSFSYASIEKIDSPDRGNMPICYSLIARK